jgi:sulfate adenylyltransferase
MGEADYRSVIDRMTLASGIPWTIPITLGAGADQASSLTIGQRVALKDPDGAALAVMTVAEKFSGDRSHEAQQVFRTQDQSHPGVQALYQQGEVLIGGPVEAIRLPHHADFPRYRLEPAETRRIFAERGWRTVVGFQTRNPVHRAHEYLQKCAMEIVDGLLLHPLVGDTKSDDIPADVRMSCYEVLLENYYPSNRTLLAVNPAAMRYAGPREAVFHAIVRRNYGCTHFIVGRDHAGVGSFYGTYDAHKIFSEIDGAALGIQPLFFDHAFFCRVCDSMASTKTCPHDKEHHVTLSGTKVRQMLLDGQMPPIEFSRPEVAKVLIEAARRSG